MGSLGTNGLTLFATNVLLCGLDLVLYCECGRSDRYCCNRTRALTLTLTRLPRPKEQMQELHIMHKSTAEKL